jgi:hypothetical protein
MFVPSFDIDVFLLKSNFRVGFNDTSSAIQGCATGSSSQGGRKAICELCGILAFHIADINYLQPWYCYFDLSPPEIGELIGIPNVERLVH